MRGTADAKHLVNTVNTVGVTGDSVRGNLQYHLLAGGAWWEVTLAPIRTSARSRSCQ